MRAAVIGTGYLGRFHAQKYAAIKGVELVAIVDIDSKQANSVANEVGCRAVTDYREILDEIDLASIVVPTDLHFDIAKECLQNNCHLLVEKPITQTIDEAEELISIARENDLVLQVGHLERFNPAIMALDGVLKNPTFIECQRMAPFKTRGTEVNVVLDLMIHDIDIILSLIGADVSQINSVGGSVLSDEVDIANARLQFETGCVANVTASRASRDTVRKIRIFQPDAYISVDYQDRKIAIYRLKGGGMPVPGLPNVTMEHKKFKQGDPLMTEIESFVKTVREGGQPVVSGEDGKRALEVAMQINEKL
ncbi:MAG: UDP-N-acetyl-D-glucosamine dehydrogenase [Desulfuromonas sp.]|nr:MAG: UDP-N-acetyl-D-glucosamine dehydrogenase [Desulfuromonas sp.]